MGIRFLCPNGHKLNVKDYLAGKKGRCPYCDTRFVIPKQSQKDARVDSLDSSSSQVGDDDESGADQIEPPTAEESLPASAFAQALPATPAPVAQPVSAAPVGYPTGQPMAARPALPDPFADAPEAHWYVRLSTGDQFGPAQSDQMRQWLGENRIPADGLVWREGWPDWKRADQTFDQLRPGYVPQPAYSAPAAYAAPVAQPAVPAYPHPAQPYPGSPMTARPIGAAPFGAPVGQKQPEGETGEFLASLGGSKGGASQGSSGGSAPVGRRKSSTGLIVLIVTLVIAALILAVVALLVTQRELPPALNDIVFKQFGYKVGFPYQTRPGSTVDENTPAGVLTYQPQISNVAQSQGYIFEAYADEIPNPQLVNDEFYRAAAEFVASENGGGTVSGGGVVTVGGYTGRAFTVQAGGNAFQVRVFVIGNTRLVMLVEDVSGKGFTASSVQQFFGSLSRAG
jgi:hypothetical protein